MTICRFILSSSNPCSTSKALSLLQIEKRDLNPVFPEESHSRASRSWEPYVPTAVLGFAGIAAFFLYSVERRAFQKETLSRIVHLNNREGIICSEAYVGHDGTTLKFRTIPKEVGTDGHQGIFCSEVHVGHDGTKLEFKTIPKEVGTAGTIDPPASLTRKPS